MLWAVFLTQLMEVAQNSVLGRENTLLYLLCGLGDACTNLCSTDLQMQEIQWDQIPGWGKLFSVCFLVLKQAASLSLSSACTVPWALKAVVSQCCCSKPSIYSQNPPFASARRNVQVAAQGTDPSYDSPGKINTRWFPDSRVFTPGFITWITLV